MRVENIRKVAVVGAGLMGSQIAEILSRVGGFSVKLVDLDASLVKKGFDTIGERIERFFVSKGKLTEEDKKAVISRIETSTNLENAVRDADLVVEAVSENLALKRDLFKKLDLAAPSHTILTSNTSYQSISEMASATKRPEKVVGTHFFNPVARMKLVEVVKGVLTSKETEEVACALARKLEKEPVVCRDSSYGFLANRAYAAMMDEAVQMVWERVASPEEIDKALKLGFNLPMGPLELMDFTSSWPIRVASESDRIRELGPIRGQLHPLIRMMHRAKYNSIYALWKDVLSKW
jgi:3-hydroxybutyryl-CoA dehydrogenase